MNIYEFMSDSPILSFFIVLIIGITISESFGYYFESKSCKKFHEDIEGD